MSIAAGDVTFSLSGGDEKDMFAVRSGDVDADRIPPLRGWISLLAVKDEVIIQVKIPALIWVST